MNSSLRGSFLKDRLILLLDLSCGKLIIGKRQRKNCTQGVR